MSPPDLPDHPGDLRLALNWFHTWFGLFVGGLLFVIFWMGTLAVFDREIDRWMMPATRLSTPPPVSADAVLPVLGDHATTARGWRMILPDSRTPVVEVQIRPASGDFIRQFVDPATLRIVPEAGTFGGTGFFYPYHFRLNVGATGLWLCAFAAVVMMALCISGIIIHRRIFADFFTLRIVRKPLRTVLDLHNLSGVLTLPFLLVISFTGVAIFTFAYLPTAQAILFDRDPAATTAGYFSRPPAGQPGGPLVSLELLRDKAIAHWAGDRPKYIQLIHPGDANGYVEIRRPSAGTVSYSTEVIWYDAASGEFLAASPVTATRRFYDSIYGIHLVQFDHWSLRWLYFLSGLAGCLLIATGLLFWVQSRRKQHEKLGLRGVRVAEAASVAVTTGLLIATLGFLIANRILPAGLEGRAAMEVWIFHGVWAAAFLHAGIRGRVAWREQAWMIAAGSLIAVLLNAVTTSQGLPFSLIGRFWSVLGVDLFLLASAAVAALSANALRKGRTG